MGKIYLKYLSKREIKREFRKVCDFDVSHDLLCEIKQIENKHLNETIKTCVQNHKDNNSYRKIQKLRQRRRITKDDLLGED
jgi:hypothetical protein